MEHNASELLDEVSDVSQVGTSFTVEEDQPVADLETNENDVPQLEELSSGKFYQEQRSSDLFQHKEADSLMSDFKADESLNVAKKSLQGDISLNVSNSKIDKSINLQSQEERVSDNHSDDMLNFEDDQQIEPTPESMKMDMSENMDYLEEENRQVDEKVVEAEESCLNLISSETDVNLSHTTNEDNQNNKSVSQATSQATPQDSPSVILISNDERNQEEVIEVREEASKDEKEIHLEEMAIALTAVTDQQQPSASVETTVAPAIRTSVSPKKSDPIEEPHLHHIKTIQDVQGKKLAIVTQNENGPCPLVAIINVLLLKRQITLPAASEIVSAAKLMEYIGDSMLSSVPTNLSGEGRLNYEQNMNDAMAVLPKLQTGLDVNVKFTGVKDFEYTPECIIFDLLRIPLYHGWLVDPQTPDVVNAIGNAGYNQVVEKVISQKSSTNPDAVTEALVIENFLERSASQLTYHGLSELSTTMTDDEIGVLFRNNHFSTIYKHQNELLQLVTDQGFLGEPNVVWETLSSIDGDGQFVDGQFRTVPPKPERVLSSSSPLPASSSPAQIAMTAEQQIDHDFLVALSLQEEQQQPSVANQEDAVGQQDVSAMSEEEKSTLEFLDSELARQLQQEEERVAAEAEAAERDATANQSRTAQSSRQPTQSPPSQPKKKDNCTFL